MSKKRNSPYVDCDIDLDNECEIKIKRGGGGGALHRMIPTRGVVTIDATAILDSVKEQMRKGYDVRLTCGGEEAVRFFPFASADCKSILVRIQPLGSAADWLKDKKITVKHCGEKKSSREVDELYREARLKDHRAPDYVTPDTMVTCPNCSYQFRVGRPNKE